jgi:hypothetical protein
VPVLVATRRSWELKSRAVHFPAPGPGGPVLKDGVSCASWSNKGKQLIAGLADGTGCIVVSKSARFVLTVI